MGMLVRKRPCPCGSGRPARDCCGRFRRLDDRALAGAFLHRQARQARDLIGPFSPAALAALQDEAATLPTRCAAFTEALLASRDPVGDDVRRVARALRRPGTDSPADAASLAVQRADNTIARVAIAKVVLTLRGEGLIDDYVAAAALVELVSTRSPLTEAALLRAGTAVAGLSSVAGPSASAWAPGQQTATA